MAKDADNPPKDPVLLKGRQRTIEYARLADGSMPAWEFYSQLPEKDKQKLFSLFQATANKGEICNKTRFNKEWDEFSAFKAKSQDGRMIRMACIRVDDRWLLLHGFYKPAQDAWPLWANTKCEKIYREHHNCWEKSGEKDESKNQSRKS